MSDITKKYLDLVGLGQYDTLIKGQILSDAADAAASAVAALDTQGNVDVATVSDGVVTLTKALSETDGIVGPVTGEGSTIVLGKVATTGAAEDVDYVNTTSGLTATDVQAAIDEVAAASAGGVNSKTIYLTDNSAGQSDYAKVYKVWQGTNAPDHATDPAALIGTINIPKDKVVQSGSVVEVFFDSSDNTLHEGSISGTDVTELIKGSTTPTSADAGKYVKLVLQNVTDPLYIFVKDLVDVYTGGSTAEVTVAVSAQNVITATIGKIAATKVIYQAESGQSGDPDYQPEITVKGKIDAVEAKVDAIDVAGDIATAIGALDTPSDVAIASNDSSTGAVTFAGSIAETDGIIGAGSDDNVIFTPITQSEINALFATTP